MRASRRLLTTAMAVCSLATFAQTPEQKPKATTAQVAVDAAKVPDAEKVRQSGEAVVRMRSVLADTLSKLNEARQSRDVVKLNCVNEKLTQVKGLLRISEQSDVNLQEAVSKKDSAAAEHEYTKVTIASSKATQLRAEAEQCIGQLAFRSAENLQVDVTEPDYLPKGDPSQLNLPPVFVTRPPPASPGL